MGRHHRRRSSPATPSGIRNFAYDVHPWTYGDYSTSVGSPHRNGEIWAAATYAIRVRLGIPLTTQLVLDGMRSTGNGPSPTFLDARDGILANDQAANGSANQCALWSAFASRGMGVCVSNGIHAVPTKTLRPRGLPPDADAGVRTTRRKAPMCPERGGLGARHIRPPAPSCHTNGSDNDGFDDATSVTAASRPSAGRHLHRRRAVTDEFGRRTPTQHR